MKASRRKFIKNASVAAAALVGCAPIALPASEESKIVTQDNPKGYRQRVAFGAWINDMRNSPLPLQNWPAMQLDAETVRGVTNALDVQSGAGFNYLDAWGLFATYAYPPDISSAFKDVERADRVRRILKIAADRDIGALFGMGLFSWGYDEIIKQDPEVRGTDPEGKPHPHAMCGAKEKSWTYVEKILDNALGQFAFRGVHLESCDLGCCMCPQCAGKDGLVGYNVRLNIRAADYIKRKWPRLIVNVIPINWVSSQAGPNAGSFNDQEKQHIIELSKHIDCLMDQGWRGTFVPREERKSFTQCLQCDYGTSGGVWVYHSARRNRLSYFLPYPKGTGNAIKEHYADGARGSMIYQGPMVNPAVEINTAVAGRLLNDAGRSIEDALTESLEVYYKPKNAAALKELASIFNRAEDAFFDNWPEEAKKNPHRPGEFHIEPLFASSPQKSMYLEWCLTPKGRGQYRKGQLSILESMAKREDDFDDGGRMERIKTCVISVLVDIENLGYEAP